MADFKQLPANVTKVAASLIQVSEARKKNQNSLKTSCKSMLTKVKSWRCSLNQLLDELGKRTVEQIDSVLADLDGLLQKDIDHCDFIYDQLKVLLDTVQAQCKESSSFIGYRKCKDKMADANRLLREMDTKQEATITFKPDTRAQQLLSDLKALENTQVYPDLQFEQHSGQIHPSSNKSKVFNVKAKKTYAVKIKKDKQDCDLFGMTELPGGEIVLVDCSSCRIKVLDREYKVTCHSSLLQNPQDICRISYHQVAVTVENWTDRHEVHFLTVSADTMKMTRKFSVDHDCYSIKHHKGQLYVGSLTAQYLYTTEGRLIKKVYQDASGHVTVNRFALSNDSMKLYIPASSHNKIIIIDKSGNILATLHDPDFYWPYRVHVSEAGHVFACFNRSHTIVQIDQDCG